MSIPEYQEANIYEASISCSLRALARHLSTKPTRERWLSKALRLQAEVFKKAKELGGSLEIAMNQKAYKLYGFLWWKWVESQYHIESSRATPNTPSKLNDPLHSGLSIDLATFNGSTSDLEVHLSKILPRGIFYHLHESKLYFSMSSGCLPMWTTEYFRLSISKLNSGEEVSYAGRGDPKPRVGLEIMVQDVAGAMREYVNNTIGGLLEEENPLCAAWLRPELESYHLVLNCAESVERLLYTRLPGMSYHFALTYSYGLWDIDRPPHLTLILPNAVRDYDLDKESLKEFQRDFAMVITYFCRTQAMTRYGPLTLSLSDPVTPGLHPVDVSTLDPLNAFHAAIFSHDWLLFHATRKRFLRMLNEDFREFIYKTEIPNPLTSHIEAGIRKLLGPPTLSVDAPDLDAISDAVFSFDGLVTSRISIYYPECPSANWYLPLVKISSKKARFTIYSDPQNGPVQVFHQAYTDACELWSVEARITCKFNNSRIEDQLLIALCSTSDKFFARILTCIREGGKVLTVQRILETFDDLGRDRLGKYYLYQQRKS